MKRNRTKDSALLRQIELLHSRVINKPKIFAKQYHKYSGIFLAVSLVFSGVSSSAELVSLNNKVVPISINQIIGTEGNDTLIGTTADDYIDGKGGNDLINGGAGNDTILGGSGDDSLFGGTGDDYLEAGEGNDKLYGGEGNDTLVAGPGTNYLQGDGGNDTYIIHKGDGEVTINDYGSSLDKDNVIFDNLNSTDISTVELPDNDTLIVNFTSDDRVIFKNRRSTSNQINSYTFADGVVFTTNDLLAYKTITLPQGGTYHFGGGNQHIIGSSGDDIIYTYGGNDKIEGLAGNDLINGGAGNDTILGGSGDDSLFGGTGDDYLEAGEGNDKLYGGEGNDTLVAGPGTNYLQGDGGNDTYIIHKGDGEVTINDYGSSLDKDNVIFDNLNSTDISTVELPDNDTLIVNFTSDDRVIFKNRRSTSNQINSYTFADGVVFTTNDLLAYKTITLPQGGTYHFGGGNQHIIGSSGDDIIYTYGGNDKIEGLAGNDLINGGAGNDTILGGSGDDSLFGGTGDDYLEAGEGNDKLYGGEGNDTLVAGPGTNYLQGDGGNDTYIIHKGDGEVTINDYGSSLDKDNVIFDNLNSTDISTVELPDNDTLIVNFTSDDRVIFKNRRSTSNQINSYTFADGVVFTTNDLLAYKTITLPQGGTYHFGGGNQHIIGSSGDDIIYTYGGNDKIEGLAGNDLINGGAGNDTILGGSGDDSLFGGTGDDYLEAGEGNDKLYGGEGNDTLVAGPGTNYLQGDGGNDTYIIHKGDGEVTINDYGSSLDKDNVIFDNLNSTDISTVELPDNDTLIVNFTSDDRVIFKNRRSTSNQINSYTFADGVVFTTNDLLLYEALSVSLKPVKHYTNEVPNWAWIKKEAIITYEIIIQNAERNIVHTEVLRDVDQFNYTSGLQNAHSYRARIRGSSDDGKSWGPWSSFSDYITVDLVAPIVKQNSFARVDSNTAILSFTANDNLSGIAKLHLQVSDNSNFKSLLLDQDISINSNSYQIDGISNISGLYARMLARDNAGNTSDYSDTIFITVAPPTLIQPATQTVVRNRIVSVLGSALSDGDVQLYLDSIAIGQPTKVSADGYFSQDIQLRAEGNYQLTAMLSNDYGSSEQSKPVSFSFVLPTPTAMIVTPTNDQEIHAPIDIQVVAADELGVEKIELYLDDTLLTSLTEQPYQAHWPLTLQDNGVHTLMAKVTNTSAKVVMTKHNVTVKIEPPAPPPTIYTGIVTNINPHVSYGPQPITITGQSIYRADNTFVANAPVKLVLKVNGFERKISIATDEKGNFSYTFVPQETDTGIYQVAIIHPDEITATPQASFSINRIEFNLQGYNLKTPRNIDTPITVNATASTGAKNLRWVLAADNQPDGNFPKGIQIASDAIDIGIGESKSTVINFIADDKAAETGSIYLIALADDSGDLVRGKLQLNYQLGQAMPTLNATPSYIQTGLQQGAMITSNISLSNKGLAKAENVQIQLVDQSGNPAPSWVFIATDKMIGTIAVDEQVPVQIVAQPDNTIADGIYRFNIKLSANNNISGSIPVSISVTQSGQGIAQFDVADIYTATLDESGQPIPGVKGATIKLQNEAVLTQEYSVISNDQGIASLENIPTGIYRYRVSAPNHMDVSGRIVIRPNTTTNEHIFLEYQTINIEFGVTETTIQDIYDITLNATFNTQVPAPVVLVEPLSINLAGLQVGEEKTGQLTITNYGLVQAKNVVLNLPKTDARFKYEFFGEVPSVLLPKEKIVIPYRVTALDPNQAKSIKTKTAIQPSLLRMVRASDDCTSYSAGYPGSYEGECANGDITKGNTSGYFYQYTGKCPSSGAGWGWGGSLGGNGGYGGGGGLGSPAAMPITSGCSPEADCASGGAGSGAK